MCVNQWTALSELASVVPFRNPDRATGGWPSVNVMVALSVSGWTHLTSSPLHQQTSQRHLHLSISCCQKHDPPSQTHRHTHRGWDAPSILSNPPSCAAGVVSRIVIYCLECLKQNVASADWLPASLQARPETRPQEWVGRGWQRPAEASMGQ